MTKTESRARVVAEARSWIGTSYMHMGAIKGVGADCAMVLVRVYVDLGLVKPFDPRPYSRDWFLHQNGERYMAFLLARAHEVAAPGLGDVALFKIGRCFAHGGIVTNISPLRIVHAYASARAVIEDEPLRDPELTRQPLKFFSYWS
jgi:cell wall-associated NlpC family hydrolase